MSVKSILNDIGKGLEKVFKAAVGIAQAAEPFVDTVFPGIADLYNTTVAEVVKAEGLAIAAGTQNGTGVQKSALVVAAITPSILAYAAANGLPTPTATTIKNYADAVVATLNAIPTLA